MKKHFSCFAALLVIFLSACAPKIYSSGEMSNALKSHKTVAILPAEVTMKLRPREMEKMTDGQYQDLVNKTARDIQEQMYTWFLNRSNKFHYTVQFQDLARTRSKMAGAGITMQNQADKDRTEIARVLGVDAVIQNNVRMDKPMSDGAALAVGVLLGTWGSTNTVATTITIHDGASGNLLWKYDYDAQGSVGSSTKTLVDALMRNASKHFPYKQDK